MRDLRIPNVLFAGVVMIVGGIMITLCRGEPWMCMEDYAEKCTLIVKAEIVVKDDDELIFTVMEIWKGDYDTNHLLRTTKESFFARHRELGVDVEDGREIVFFFTSETEPVAGRISGRSRAFPVKGGYVRYPAKSSQVGELLGLGEFKKRITEVASGAERKIIEKDAPIEAENGWEYVDGISEPEWGADGKSIAFTRSLRIYVSEYATWYGKTEIWVTSKDGKDVRRLVEGQKLFWESMGIIAYRYWKREEGKQVACHGLVDTQTGEITKLEEQPSFRKIRFQWNGEQYAVVDTKLFYERNADSGWREFYGTLEELGRSRGLHVGHMDIRNGVILATKYWQACDTPPRQGIVYPQGGSFSEEKMVVMNGAYPSLSPDGMQIAFLRDGSLWIRNLEEPLKPVVTMLSEQ